MAFNYNQLNIVGRDRQSIEWIKNVLIHELENLRDKVSVKGESFKNVINTANDVWEGADKDQFVKNITASANEYSANIDVMISNLKKYIDQDLKDFDSMQKNAKNIANQRYNMR